MKQGDLVIMNGKREFFPGEQYKIWTVDSVPCALQDRVVVKLKGRDARYPVDGLTVISPADS